MPPPPVPDGAGPRKNAKLVATLILYSPFTRPRRAVTGAIRSTGAHPWRVPDGSQRFVSGNGPGQPFCLAQALEGGPDRRAAYCNAQLPVSPTAVCFLFDTAFFPVSGSVQQTHPEMVLSLPGYPKDCLVKIRYARPVACQGSRPRFWACFAA